jgi:hypothetical protein
MKNLLSAFGFLLISTVGVCQVVDIPDPHFKILLVNNSEINTNGDEEIQVEEAAAFKGTISYSHMNLFDLKGIEAFTALTELYCSENNLTSLDVSANTSLIKLSCSSNKLETLDVSSNEKLTHLYCGNNKLSQLDVSNNIKLKYFDCAMNQLTNIDVSSHFDLLQFDIICNNIKHADVSSNSALRVFYCRHNPLDSIDVSANKNLIMLDCYDTHLKKLNVKNGNNSNFLLFYSKGNPELSCIEVDNAKLAETNWRGQWGADSTSSFSEDCNTTIEEEINFIGAIYPNPATTHLTVINPTLSPTDFSIYDISGKLILKGNFSPYPVYDRYGAILNSGDFLENITISISDFAAGAYIVELVSEEGSSRQKFIKQ